MTPLSSKHLTTEQLYDLLDHPAQSVGTHMYHCALCQRELTSLQQSLTNFRKATTGLASADLPALLQPEHRSVRVVPVGFRRQAWAATLATAAVLLTASVTVIHTHRDRPGTPSATPTHQPQADATESDEALLAGIQQDLSTPVPPSLAPLQVPAGFPKISK